MAAMSKEIFLRKDFLSSTVSTIYLGGGTPSLVSPERISELLDTIRQYFILDDDIEITLEANPDDINLGRAVQWKKAGINRISLGIQSFRDEWLQWMNRAHNADQSIQAIQTLQEAGLTNLSIDLIFGLPEQTLEAWSEEINTAIHFDIPHLSCYALTSEPKTTLWRMIETGKSLPIDADQQAGMFLILMDKLEHVGYEHYEISNFAQPGFRSRHNSSYWNHIPYLGIGPSAHSFNGKQRMWNIKNNAGYLKQINSAHLPLTIEELSPAEHWNEYVMIALRKKEGINLIEVEEQWGKNRLNRLIRDAGNGLERQLLINEQNHLRLTRAGKLLADQITVEFFDIP